MASRQLFRTERLPDKREREEEEKMFNCRKSIRIYQSTETVYWMMCVCVCVFTRVDSCSHPRSFIRRDPFGQHCMRAWNDWTFAQALDEAHHAQPKDAARTGRIRYQECKHRIDEHAPAQKAHRTESLGQHAEWYLGEHVAVEER